MEVYHGSIVSIKSPSVSAGRPNLDFGRGFYVTDIRSQAETWALRLAERKGAQAIVNVYELDLNVICERYKHFRFTAYDEAWLQFIISCRQGDDVWKNYDVIEGGVANDRVIDTIEAYIAGLMPIDYALRELAKHQPNNQLCITNQQVINEFLHFVKSEYVK